MMTAANKCKDCYVLFWGVFGKCCHFSCNNKGMITWFSGSPLKYPLDSESVALRLDRCYQKSFRGSHQATTLVHCHQDLCTTVSSLSAITLLLVTDSNNPILMLVTVMHCFPPKFRKLFSSFSPCEGFAVVLFSHRFLKLISNS